VTTSISCPGAGLLNLDVSSLDYADLAETIGHLVSQDWHVHLTVDGRHYTCRPGADWHGTLRVALGVADAWPGILAACFIVFMLLGGSIWLMNRLS
jgi:hypothetical protein